MPVYLKKTHRQKGLSAKPNTPVFFSNTEGKAVSNLTLNRLSGAAQVP